jgi:triphosphoribosyl-dephospho-CoA synthase
MTGPLTRDQIETAYRAACRLEVRTLKPGNVHIFADGHRMTVEDFDRSTDVSAPHISDPTLPVGTRIRRAVEATFTAVGQNTNLGIVLLCAPLAAAAEKFGPATLADKLKSVLAGLDHEDAREVYSAIATANPAGLGEDKSGDVRAEPPADWTLLDAMLAAASRDLIANEYATGFAAIFANARTFAAHLKSGASAEDALAHLFLRQLAERPDTHIIRKHGPGLAQRVQDRAAGVLAELTGAPPKSLSVPANHALLMEFDAELKSWGANPGSLADLMCASVFTSTLDAAAPKPVDS